MIEPLDSLTSPTPFFFNGTKGKVFAIFYPPQDGPLEHVVIHIPAFAEEMNKARRMVALQAREFAVNGIGVLVVDLFGTGDSEGDFSDATWDLWKNDLGLLCNQLVKQRISDISLWGLRVGALLALDFAGETEYLFNKLLLWQPVLNGESFLLQFLRLRVASAMFSNNTTREKVANLKNILLAGQSLEVAGYMIDPALANGLATVKADKIDTVPFKKICLVEIAPTAREEHSPAIKKFVSRLEQANLSTDSKIIVGLSFWATQEISTIPQLLQDSVVSLTTD